MSPKGNACWYITSKGTRGRFCCPQCPTDTVIYTYGDANWGDKLTAYDGATITYDNVGNPLNDGTWTYTWEHGRQLASMTDGTTTISYTYNAEGLRIGKTVTRSNYSETHEYYYNNGNLTCDIITIVDNGETIEHYLQIAYDESGRPLIVTYDHRSYFYLLNAQGDVMGISGVYGDLKVAYTYDAWGNVLSVTGPLADTLGYWNPCRYRGYVYDRETGFYYLQSRYYNPEVGRFINADALVATGQGLLGNNMFAYCRNNPVKRKDASGTDDVCVTNADEDNNPLNDFGPISGGGGYANAYNSIDAGYHYGVDFSMAVNSSLTTGGIYANGYTAYGVYSSPTSSGYSSTSMTSACFVAGTLVQSEDGSKAIEDISAGDKVWAWDEETSDVALKEVVETYINETDKLIHVFVNGEEIITTPTHPFYSPVKGWTDACKLRAGDMLVLVNGEYVIVEKVQHEMLEAPIAVYNFQVADYHTYYVSNVAVLVHNTCSNPYGKKGGAAHQGTIATIKSDLISRGYSVVEEYRVDTSGGHKNTRYLDLYATNGYDSFGVQVGRMTRSGFPVARERRALSDILDSGINAMFVRYK